MGQETLEVASTDSGFKSLAIRGKEQVAFLEEKVGKRTRDGSRVECERETPRRETWSDVCKQPGAMGQKMP